MPKVVGIQALRAFPLWITQTQLQSNATESSETELALHNEVRGLRSDLDEAKRKASRLSQEQRELSLRLEDSEKDKETLKQTISQLEETKNQQEKALEKLNKEVSKKYFFFFTIKYCGLSSLLNREHTIHNIIHLV